VALTYYEVLGVTENASETEIEAAFKSKAREVHPDKVAPGSPYLRKVAAEAFKDLSEAKTVLLNRAERQKYDAELAYLRGSAASSSPSPQPAYQASQPPPQPPRAPASAPQPAQKYSFWKPADTKFGFIALLSGGLGCVLLLVGIAGSEKTAFLGLTFVFLAFAMLCWRHGLRPSTDPKVLGGSVFLLIFAAMSFAALFDSPSPSPKPQVALKTGAEMSQPPVTSPDVVPCKTVNAKTCVGSSNASGISSAAIVTTPKVTPPHRSIGTYPILAAINAGSEAKRETPNVESAPNKISQNGAIIQDPSPTPPRSSAVPVFDGGLPSQSGTGSLDLSRLSSAERQSLESACLIPKMNDGPAAYNRCLEGQLAQLRTAPQRPDLSGLSYPEKQSIESACLIPKMNDGPAAYNRCLEGQLAQLRTAPQRPDLSGLSYPEKQSIESACLIPKMNDGPASYNRCLQRQLELLKKSR
jgi:hypothetical protein